MLAATLATAGFEADPSRAVAAASPRAASEGQQLVAATSAIRQALTRIVPPRARAQPAFTIERIRPGASVVLRGRPGGRPLATVTSTTEFGSPQTLPVLARRGSWLGVASAALPNNELGWLSARSRAVTRAQTRVLLRVDVARRELDLREGRRVLRRVTVGVGTPGSPTPTGRFAITDKLSGAGYGGAYGCCILALSGHQPNTPAGWQGGNRLAIHGTDDPTTIGVPSTAGCLSADSEDLRLLMRRVPLGAPVVISR